MPNLVIRSLNVSESKKFLELLIALDAETNFLLFEKNERSYDVERCEDYLKKVLGVNNGLIFVVETPAGDLVGHVTGERYGMNKKRHVMRVSIGLLQKYYGLGRQLVNAFIETIEIKKMASRLEAEIISTNKIALNMAKKCGFAIEGIKHNAVCIKGEYYAEYMIARVRNDHEN